MMITRAQRRKLMLAIKYEVAEALNIEGVRRRASFEQGVEKVIDLVLDKLTVGYIVDPDLIQPLAKRA